MSSSSRAWDGARIGAWFVGAVGTLLVVGGLTWFVAVRTRPPGVDVVRAKLRASNLAEVRGEVLKLSTTYEEVDKSHGIWRIPVAQAVELSLRLWQDPAAARSNLLSRVDKATAKVPEKPSEYE